MQLGCRDFNLTDKSRRAQICFPVQACQNRTKFVSSSWGERGGAAGGEWKPLLDCLQCLCRPFSGDRTHGIDPVVPGLPVYYLRIVHWNLLTVNQPASIFLFSFSAIDWCIWPEKYKSCCMICGVLLSVCRDFCVSKVGQIWKSAVRWIKGSGSLGFPLLLSLDLPERQLGIQILWGPLRDKIRLKWPQRF